MCQASRIVTPAIDPRDFRFDPPSFSDAALRDVAGAIFGVRGELWALRGERDQNQLLVTNDGERLVLKVSAASEDPDVVDLQAQTLLHLEQEEPELPVPRLRPTLDGAPWGEVTDREGTTHPVRMLTWLDGITFEEAGPVSREGLLGVGAFQGRLCAALARFEHRAAEHFMPWDISNGLLADDRLWQGLGQQADALAGPVRSHLAEAVMPAMTELRRQVVHNDAHRGNLLRPDTVDEHVVGLIDFGDLVHAPLAADLAICAASFVANGNDPAGAVAAVAEGFHTTMPLVDDEIDVLYDLVLARLVLTLLLFAFQDEHAPEHRLHLAREHPVALRDLELWLNVDSSMATETFRSVLAKSSA
jgi:Ser/Thr protein kinase RdoA (MazF antagonist)